MNIGDGVPCFISEDAFLSREIVGFTTCGKPIVTINKVDYVVIDGGEAIRFSGSGYLKEKKR